MILTLRILVAGLDIPKHGEPAYPLASYGDGWSSESPPTPKHLPYTYNGHANEAVQNGRPLQELPRGAKVNPAVVADVEQGDTKF